MRQNTVFSTKNTTNFLGRGTAPPTPLHSGPTPSAASTAPRPLHAKILSTPLHWWALRVKCWVSYDPCDPCDVGSSASSSRNNLQNVCFCHQKNYIPVCIVQWIVNGLLLVLQPNEPFWSRHLWYPRTWRTTSYYFQANFRRARLCTVVVWRWTCDREVAGSTPGRCIAG